MCTAAIGPILNAGVALAQASAQRAAVFERAREEQERYRKNASLALRSQSLQSTQQDKQTREQVRETNQAAFDQIMQQRDTLAQARAADASVGRTGRSTLEVYGAIGQMGARNVGRLAHRRSMLVEFGQDRKKGFELEAQGRIDSVPMGKVSQAELAAISINAIGGVIGAFNQGWSNMQQNSMTVAQTNYQQGYYESRSAYNTGMMNMYGFNYSGQRSNYGYGYGGR